MFRNIIKTTLRHFIRYRGYSLTNIFGLAIGLATCIIIFLYVQDELNYDRFFDKAESIYRLEPHWVGQGEDQHWAASQGGLLPEIMKNYPEISAGVKINRPYNPIIFKIGDVQFVEKNVLNADSTFFKVFDYRILSGDPDQMLTGPKKLVMTESTALRYFGKKDALGGLVKIDEDSYVVSGVIQDTPANSHLQFDMLISMDDLRTRWAQLDENGPSAFYSYIKFTDPEQVGSVKMKFNEHVYTHFGYVVAGDSTNMPEGYTAELIFNPITDIHLKGRAEKEISINSDMQYVYIFSSVAIFVLIIACFNYMNLATAKSTRRSKEVGLRKVMGATSGDVFNQFMGESFTLTFISTVIAITIVEIVLPEFNRFTDKQLVLGLFSNLPLIISLIIIILVVGFLSGTYPSVFMSRFNPISTLKGSSISAGGSNTSLMLRRGLVVAQFTISIFLIIGIITVNQQLNYIQHKNLGFSKEQVLVIQLPNRAIHEKVEVMKNEMLIHSDITFVDASSNIPGERIPFLSVRIPGEDDQRVEETENDEDDSFAMRTWSAGIDFVDVLGLDVIEGRGFSRDFETDATSAFLINEAAVKDFDLENPVGHRFEYLWGLEEPKRGKIIGVVKDFHYASLHHEVEPLVIHVYPQYHRYLLVKMKTNNIKRSLKKVEEVWNAHITYLPIDYAFLDTRYDNLYKKEQNTGAILGIFTILAIIIAVLGLFGLASYITEQRTKEIGIRKVLGASALSIIGKLSWEFILLVIFANVIAWIPAILFLRNWLDTFAFRTSMSVWVFIISAFFSITIAILTVSSKAFKSARRNPVEALKFE